MNLCRGRRAHDTGQHRSCAWLQHVAEKMTRRLEKWWPRTGRRLRAALLQHETFGEREPGHSPDPLVGCGGRHSVVALGGPYKIRCQVEPWRWISKVPQRLDAWRRRTARVIHHTESDRERVRLGRGHRDVGNRRWDEPVQRRLADAGYELQSRPKDHLEFTRSSFRGPCDAVLNQRATS